MFCSGGAAAGGSFGNAEDDIEYQLAQAVKSEDYLCASPPLPTTPDQGVEMISILAAIIVHGYGYGYGFADTWFFFVQWLTISSFGATLFARNQSFLPRSRCAK